MRRMKILVLIGTMEAGGAERVVSILCNSWCSSGHSVTLMPTFSGGGASSFYPLDEKIDLVYLSDLLAYRKKNVFTYLKRLIKLRYFIKCKNPDIVISFLPNVNAAAILSTLFLSVPVICCERRDPSSQKANRAWEFLFRKIYRFADLFVVQTEQAKNSVLKMYPKVRIVHVIENPILQETLNYQALPNKKTRNTLVSLGRLIPEKQVDKIISIFSAIAISYPDWDLLIYGDGPERASLEKITENLNLKDRVFFKGKTGTPWKALEDADIFLMASRCEGFPNALLEAMAIGVPCVAFDCPSGPKELLKEACSNYLIPLDDVDNFKERVEFLLENEDERVKIGILSRALAIENRALDKIMNKWDHVLFSLIQFDSNCSV